MISESHAFRAASMLLDQGRFDLAEKQLRLALAEDPNSALAHAYLALCLSEREAHTEATTEAHHAVGLEPEDGFMHFTLASVLARRNMTREAVEAAWEAVGIEPDEARNWGMLASSLAMEKKYQEALDAADRGLALSPDDPVCVNVRAQALAGMGRSKDAAATIDGALAKNPDSALTHANMGWTLLQRGGRADVKQALVHFRESLRLDPTSDWARHGLVEAMKARYFLYRIMLGYFLFMARLPGRTQWLIVVGGLVGYNVLRSVASGNPALSPYIQPVLFAYLAFVALTWLSFPLANLLLSLNRFGRASLRRDQLLWSWALGAWIALCAVLWLARLAFTSALLQLASLMFLPLIIPLAMIGMATRGVPRWIMIGYTLVVAAVALMIIPLGAVDPDLMKSAIMIFVLGCLLSPLALNILNSFRAAVKK